MDFTLTDEQEALAGLAGQILVDLATPERLVQMEAEHAGGTRWFDERSWDEMAKAGLLGVGVPAAAGGLGYGLVEVALVLEQVGRAVAPGAFLPHLLAGLVLGRMAPAPLADRLLRPVAEGSVVATIALHDLAEASVPVEGRRAGDGWELAGTLRFVPGLDQAGVVLVPAHLEGRGLTLVAVEEPALRATRSRAVNGEPLATVVLGAGTSGRAADTTLVGPADVLDAGAAEWLLPRATLAHCAVQSGVCEGALRLTAAYVSEREQFGAKIGTFQAVGQRAADAYIDAAAVRLTMLQAAWLLDQDHPDAPRAGAVAKFWAAEGAQRVVHSAQHLHGGIGVDTDYPVHRFFRWAKVHELALGGGAQHLVALGRHLASR